MTIRNGTRDDHPAISALFVEWKMSEGEAVDQLTYASMFEVLVDERDGVVAGFILLMEHMIVNIITDKHHRRQGIAEGLMRAAQERRDELQLEVQPDNEAGISLYSKCGFVVKKIEQSGSRLMEWKRGLTPADT